MVICGLLLILAAFVPDIPDEPRTMGDRVLAGVVGLVLIAACLGGYALAVRNRFVAGLNRCKMKCADLDALLERRRDLAKNLMAVSDQFATQHGGGFADAAAFMGTSVYSSALDRGRESQKRLLPTFLVAAEAYPELAADRPFGVMIDQLRETEDQIAAARAEYGNADLEHNTRIGSFPSSVPARIFRFSEQESL